MKTQERGAGADASKPLPLSLENGAGRGQGRGHTPNFTAANQTLGVPGDRDMDRWQYSGESPQTATVDEFNFNTNMNMPMNNVGNNNFPWEMIGLGLEEPLPTQETIDEL